MQSLLSLRHAPTQRFVRTLERLQTRRYAHDSRSSHPVGKDESFGRGFYVSLALIPTLLALYKFTAPDANSETKPYLTRLIGGLDRWRADLAQREDLHTRTIEQAGRDRNLFLNSGDVRTAPMRFPEELNSGSPYNVPAGQGRGNYEKALARYQKEAYEDNEAKLRAMKDGTLRVEQKMDFTSHKLVPTGS